METRVTFYPLLACNARCPFCSTRVYRPEGIFSVADYLEGDLSRPLGEHGMSLAEARAAYRGFRERGVEEVNLQGGEPTLWPPLPELIRYGHELGFRDQIVITNGRRLRDPALAAELISAAPSTIGLSLFGADAATHDASLGGAGAFDDLVEAVRHLVALATANGGKSSLVGQLLLHSRNFRELPAMFDFWRGLGLQNFGIRLLRDVVNTKEDRSWFFDLRELKPYLERTLDAAIGARELRVTISELFHCLVAPEYLGAILGDLAAARRLQLKNLVVSRHRPLSPDAPRRLRIATSGTPCDGCDLGELCARLAPPFAALYGGALTPIHLGETIVALARGPLDPARRPHLEKLLSELRALGETAAPLGIPEAAIAELERTVAPLCTGEERHAVARALGRNRAGLSEIRYQRASELGAASLEGEPRELVTRLRRAASGEPARILAFLERTECSVSARRFKLFSGRLPPRPGAPLSIPFHVFLYDDRKVREEELAQLVASLRQGREPVTAGG